MTREDQEKYAPPMATLRDGSTARIRFLQANDGEKLGDFYDALPRAARRFYRPYELNRENALKACASRAESPFYVCLLVETPDGGIGGYAWYIWSGENAQESGFGICISGEYQSQGVGRILMENLLDIAREVGPPIMHLSCQHANFRAVRLYQKMGFRVTREGWVPERYGFPAERQYWMRRPVR